MGSLLGSRTDGESGAGIRAASSRRGRATLPESEPSSCVREDPQATILRTVRSAPDVSSG